MHPPPSSSLSPLTSLKSSASIPCSHVSKSSENRISSSTGRIALESCTISAVLRFPEKPVLSANHEAILPRIACDGWLAGCCRGRGEATRLAGSDTEDNNMLAADLCDDEGGASRLRALPARPMNGVCDSSIRRRFALEGATQDVRVRANVGQDHDK